jgi:hypothetical protein
MSVTPFKKSMLPIARHSISSDCGWRRRPADKEGSCESGYAAADSRQGVVIQNEGWARDQLVHTLKKSRCYVMWHGTTNLTCLLELPQQCKMGKGFTRWNVRSLYRYRSGLLKAVSRELAKNGFRLLVVQGWGGQGRN